MAERVRDGRVNVAPRGPQRSTADIVRANVVTPVNLIIVTLFGLILVGGR